MNGATSTPVLAFAELLDELRRQGFVIGVDQHLRLQQLLDQLADQVTPGRLKTHLAPIFATSREEQERFYRTFERLYPAFLEAESEQRRRESGAQPEPIAPAEVPVGSPRRRWTRAAGLGGMLLLVLGLWWISRPHPTPGPLPPDSMTVAPAPVVEPGPPTDSGQSQTDTGETSRPRPFPLGPERGFLVQHRQALRLTALVLVLGLFLANEWRLYRRRRLVVSRARRQKPPFTWPVRLEAPINPFAESAEVPGVARLLRQREPGEMARLAIEETVRATIAARGFPTFRYRADTRAPEYLLLIERTAFRDHGARLYQALAQALEREGVHVTRYLHDGDPRVCYAEQGERRELLVDLRRRYPDYRLLLVTRGERLLDPVTGRLQPWTTQFLSWSDRALLTPESPAAWGLREVALAQHFVVLPATVAGLLGAVGHFRGPARAEADRWRELEGSPDVPRLDDGDPLPRLRGYLGPRAFRWLCAVAVYPELHWDLTLHFARLPILGPGLLTEENLLRLLRLPWFRQGLIPDEVRTGLIDELTEAEERAVREAIVELLERNPAPGDSVSANRYDLDLVVQRMALHRRDPVQRQRALRELQGFPRRDLVQDFAMLKLMEETPASRLQVLLPRRLRRIFYRDGVPALGLRAAARAGLLAAAVGAGLFLTRAPATPALPRLVIFPTFGDFGRISDRFDEFEMVVGEETALRAETPWEFRGGVYRRTQAAVTWTSDAATIAEVDREGRLSARAPGVATIEAVSLEGDTARLRIRVTPTEYAFVSRTLSLHPGDLRSLKIVVPSQADRELATLARRKLAWLADDTTVARITSPGVILAVGPGKTRVSASGFGRDAKLEVIVSGPELALQPQDQLTAWNDTLAGILGRNLSPDGRVVLLVGERIPLMSVDATRFRRRWVVSPATLALIDRGNPQPGGIGYGGSPRRPEEVKIHRDELVGLAPGTGVLELETEDGSRITRPLVIEKPSFDFGADSLTLSVGEPRTLALRVPSQRGRPFPGTLRAAVRLRTDNPDVVRVEGLGLVGLQPGKALIEGIGFGSTVSLVVVVQAGAGATAAEGERDRILDTYRRFVDALRQGDLPGALRLYPGMPSARRRQLQGLFSRRTAVDTTGWSVGEVRRQGDTATVEAQYQRILRDSLNSLYTYTATRSARLLKQSDGWQIVDLSGAWEGPLPTRALDSLGRQLRFLGPAEAQRGVEGALDALGQALASGSMGALVDLYPDMSPATRAGYDRLFREGYRLDTSHWRLISFSLAGDTALAGLAGRTDLVSRDGRRTPTGSAPVQMQLLRRGDRWVVSSLNPAEQGTPTEALALYNRGLLYRDNGALSEARESMLRALALYPGYRAVQQSLDSLRSAPPPGDSGLAGAFRIASGSGPLRVPVGALVPLPLFVAVNGNQVPPIGPDGVQVHSSDTSVAKTVIEGPRIWVKGVAPGEATIDLAAGESHATIRVLVSPRDSLPRGVPPEAEKAYRQAAGAETRGDLGTAREGYREALRLAPDYTDASSALTRVVLTLRVGDWAKHLSQRSLAGLRQMYPTMPERDQAAWRGLLENPSVTGLTAVPRGVVVELVGEKEARVTFTMSYTIDSRPNGRQTSASRYRAVFQVQRGAWIITAMEGQR